MGECHFGGGEHNESPNVVTPPSYTEVTMIYLDCNATTPVAPHVLEEMLPAFTAAYGNPSNTAHEAGRRAADLIDLARERVAAPFGTAPARVVFTSGSTESLNLVIKGLELPARRNRILVGSTEHKAVLEAAAARSDARIETVPVLADGLLDLEALETRLCDDVALVAVMAVNNETGVIHPLDEAFRLARQCGALILCDATQAVGRMGLEMVATADFVSVSAHKIYGPKGAGCLIGSREGMTSLRPIASGGAQERGLRSGTLNVPGIIGLGAATSLVTSEQAGEIARQGALRDRLHEQLAARVEGVHLNGHGEQRVCNTVNLRFERADGEAILANLQNVAASVGSACQSAVPAPSHVLRAMGLSATEAEQSLRFSLGRFITETDIDAAVDDIVAAVTRVRELEDA